MGFSPERLYPKGAGAKGASPGVEPPQVSRHPNAEQDVRHAYPQALDPPAVFER